MDDIGRQRLRNLCQDFHTQCRKLSPDDEMARLHNRVQALATNNCFSRQLGTDEETPPVRDAGTSDDPHPTQGPSATQPPREAKLRVPTSSKAENWWNPRYWSIARPTDFCYGDCAWGIGQQPMHGDGPEKSETHCISVSEFIKNLFLREEMEYDVPGDDATALSAGWQAARLAGGLTGWAAGRLAG